MRRSYSTTPAPVDTDRTDDRDTSSPSKADVFLETGLLPEEYVLAEIEARGGRLQQQEICSYTGWSDGCVSRLLSEMEAEGTIERIRLGNEKLVYLPGSKPECGPPSGDAGGTDARSPP